MYRSKTLFALLLASLIMTISINVPATSDHDDHAHETGHDSHAHEERTQIAAEIARQVGITVAKAGSVRLRRTLPLYGKTTTSPGQVSHIRARFPGLITQVKVTIGDRVKAGDLLAEIESNESLKKYALRAPMAGIVTQRQANVGELAQDQALFAIANLDSLWAELNVFPAQRAQVSAGQPVLISVEALHQETTLRHLIPDSDGHPFVLARAPINNKTGSWTPGLLVEGQVVVETVEVPLAVDNRALQIMNERPVVFVQEGDAYEARPIEPGRRDDTHTEVLSGLKAGDRYVVENSYLIKADIEKAGAEHHH